MSAPRTETPRRDETPIPANAGGTNAAPPDPEIRIYVACLAAYNNGKLHGRWIDTTEGEDHIWAETRAMLAASPEPDAEEWAIHDYEGFEGVDPSEWTDFAIVAAFAEFIGEHGELGGKLCEHFGGTLDEAKAALEDYAGVHRSLEEFAFEFTEQTGVDIPKSIENYVDYAAMGRDMELGGDIFTIETGIEEVHIFWTR